MTYLSDTKDKDSGLGYCNGSETAVCDREYTDAEAVDESGLTLAGSPCGLRGTRRPHLRAAVQLSCEAK